VGHPWTEIGLAIVHRHPEDLDLSCIDSSPASLFENWGVCHLSYEMLMVAGSEVDYQELRLGKTSVDPKAAP
jgi:hypothetical protein